MVARQKSHDYVVPCPVRGGGRGRINFDRPCIICRQQGLVLWFMIVTVGQYQQKRLGIRRYHLLVRSRSVSGSRDEQLQNRSIPNYRATGMCMIAKLCTRFLIAVHIRVSDQ